MVRAEGGETFLEFLVFALCLSVYQALGFLSWFVSRS